MRSNIPLEVIDIPRPCPADWNAMHGNTQVRFCDHCQLHVYNLSAMTRDAAQQLIAEKEGKLCARLYRRVDGTVITADCGRGWKLRAKKLSRVLAGACAAILGGMFVTHAWADAVEVRGQVAVQGDMAMPMQGSIAPLPPSTQPTTQPAENPDEQPTMGKVVARPTTQPVEE